MRGYVWLIGFVGTVFAANWAIEAYGPINIGFGLMAPAGVLFAGLAFTFRDLIHDDLGREWVLIAIAVGALASLWVNPAFAAASALAFAASELIDFAVYTPLRDRAWLGAVVASNIVGLTVDSLIFLRVAFGPDGYDFLVGQIVAKSYMTIAAVIVLWCIRPWLSRREPERIAA